MCSLLSCDCNLACYGEIVPCSHVTRVDSNSWAHQGLWALRPHHHHTWQQVSIMRCCHALNPFKTALLSVPIAGLLLWAVLPTERMMSVAWLASHWILQTTLGSEHRSCCPNRSRRASPVRRCSALFCDGGFNASSCNLAGAASVSTTTSSFVFGGEDLETGAIVATVFELEHRDGRFLSREVRACAAMLNHFSLFKWHTYG